MSCTITPKVLLALLFIGCEEDITPGHTDLPFTLYGLLSAPLDSQWVRVSN